MFRMAVGNIRKAIENNHKYFDRSTLLGFAYGLATKAITHCTPLNRALREDIAACFAGTELEGVHVQTGIRGNCCPHYERSKPVSRDACGMPIPKFHAF